MAESSADYDGSGSSWWGGWLQTVQEKSAGALEFVKKDLAEFTNTMQRDTTSAVKVTSSTLQDTFKPENTEAAKDKMKKSINGFFDGITKALTVPPDEQEVSKTKPRDLSSSSPIYDRSKARLHAVQVDPNTYLKEPSGHPEYFEKWLETFNLESKKGDISELLVVKVEVRAMYTKLVPSELSHSEFWQRYFYKLYQLQQDEARKQALMKRAETPTEVDSLGWEDDWSGDETEEFERVTASEVKAVQEEDVQARLAPGPDNKEDGKVDSKEEQVVKESPKDSERPTEPTVNIQDSNESPPPKQDDTGTISEHSKVDEIKTDKTDVVVPPVTQCDSTDKETTKDTSQDPTEIPDSSTRSDKPEVPEPKLPLTSKETDLLAAASKDKDSVEKVVPEQEKSEVPTEVAGSDVKVKVVKEDNSKSDSVESVEKDIKTKVKGDLVLVGSDRESPSSDSSGYKEPSVDDDWEQDFDVELTEEQKKAYEEISKKMGDNLDSQEDDWESWE